MNVVLFRHAQKGMIPFENPHLTTEGFVQADAIAACVQEKKLPAPTDIWVSEKIRTHQTLQAVAANCKVTTEIKHELDLRNDHETQKMFQNRVNSLIDLLTITSEKDSSLKTIYLCTHYDWIEEAMALIPCDTNLSTYEFSHWGPAQYASFQIENGLWKLTQKGTCR